jgi:hypothetical protein
MLGDLFFELGIAAFATAPGDLPYLLHRGNKISGIIMSSVSLNVWDAGIDLHTRSMPKVKREMENDGHIGYTDKNPNHKRIHHQGRFAEGND